MPVPEPAPVSLPGFWTSFKGLFKTTKVDAATAKAAMLEEHYRKLAAPGSGATLGEIGNAKRIAERARSKVASPPKVEVSPPKLSKVETTPKPDAPPIVEAPKTGGKNLSPLQATGIVAGSGLAGVAIGAALSGPGLPGTGNNPMTDLKHG